jgi:hypothetical protein
MTRADMSAIIETALRGYGWTQVRRISLPDFIANAIADSEPVVDEIRRLRSKLKQAEAEIDGLRRIEQANTENLAHLRSKLAEADAEVARLNANADAEKNYRDKLDAEIVRTTKLLGEARAVAPHFYAPSAQHMGDCAVCGNTANAPQHDVGQWRVRAIKAEDEFAALKAKVARTLTAVRNATLE